MWRESGPAPEEVYDLLYRLGLTASSSGFFHLACAVRLAVDQPQRLLVPTWLYPAVGRRYRVNPETVEGNIRRLSVRVWNNAPGRLSRLAGVTLHSAPSPARFLSILANSLRGGHAA